MLFVHCHWRSFLYFVCCLVDSLRILWLFRKLPSRERFTWWHGSKLIISWVRPPIRNFVYVHSLCSFSFWCSAPKTKLTATFWKSRIAVVSLKCLEMGFCCIIKIIFLRKVHCQEFRCLCGLSILEACWESWWANFFFPRNAIHSLKH